MTEEPGGLQLQRVGHDCVTNTFTHITFGPHAGPTTAPRGR